MKQITAHYRSIESFALVDGPHVRSVLFLQGCPFRCLYCHNPDTWDFNKGNSITPQEAANKLLRFKNYWGDKGGVTISGGEPLAQLDFLIELGKELKKLNVSYIIDTSGATFSTDPTYLAKMDELLKYTDLFLLDIKAIDKNLHKKITGYSNENIISFFNYLNNKNFPIWIRYVLVPNLTDDTNTLNETYNFMKTLNNIQRIEVLPYHNLAIIKYKELNINYPLINTPMPSQDDLKKAEDLLHVSDYKRYLKM